MHPLTKNDIPRHAPATIDAGNGHTLKIEVERDDDMGPPWAEHDGHGPVSEWERRDKRPGEMILATDHGARRFYDFAEAVKIARRDGWDTPPYKTGTAGERAHRAAMADFNHLRRWCADLWQWVWVRVSLLDPDGREIASDSIGGVESEGEYWRELAAEMANTLKEAQAEEMAERGHWEARDVMTEGQA